MPEPATIAKLGIAGVNAVAGALRDGPEGVNRKGFGDRDLQDLFRQTRTALIGELNRSVARRNQRIVPNPISPVQPSATTTLPSGRKFTLGGSVAAQPGFSFVDRGADPTSGEGATPAPGSGPLGPLFIDPNPRRGTDDSQERGPGREASSIRGGNDFFNPNTSITDRFNDRPLEAQGKLASSALSGNGDGVAEPWGTAQRLLDNLRRLKVY